MSDDAIQGVGSSQFAKDLKAEKLEGKQLDHTLNANQSAKKANLQDMTEYFNPLEFAKKFKTLADRTKPPETKEAGDQKEKEVLKDKAIIKLAKTFTEKNPELHSRALLALRSYVKPGDTPQTILSKVKESYPDEYKTDEALRFLAETSTEGTDHHEALIKTRERFNTLYGREIKAGKNISTEARAFSKEGLGTPDGLRSLYKDITGNPREPLPLFNELLKSFDFEKMKQALEFILHSLGADMKSKGPSISRGELQNMFSGARTMQAILGVFNFFKMRMRLVGAEFKRGDLDLPGRLTYKLIAEQFMKLIAERYPSPDKIFKLATLLGISKELLAQIIVYTQYRDALRHVSPKLFKSDRHRQDLLKTLMDAISDLDDQLDDDDDDDEDEDDDDEPRRPGLQDTLESME